ncbi:uncharacterized protein LOC108680714 [Hyalella azteca]|uniref:Uncharacterized protein LOC108680714 n=1 Tax=Hyalella azteca TaxID=294128 RepID=A0A8B7PID1_HYAAZ|nr:uncharacterized protein LOC108680714 [Hyalella azteca]
MATALLECEVCDEAYDSGNHKPLCLTCGHTFCFSCITSLLGVPETQNCPKCRGQISQRADQMLVNYALIPSEVKARLNPLCLLSAKPCNHQGKAQDYLCADCMELVCFTCTRGTHATHKIETIDDLLQEEVGLADSWAKLRITMKDKLESVNSFVSVSEELLSLIDEILNLKTDFKEWKDELLAQKASAERDLEVWGDETRVTDENTRQKLKELISRLKLKPEGNKKIQEIKARLNAASTKCTSLELPTCELMLQGAAWTITNSDEGERALVSLVNNRKPSSLVVLSTHTRPIPGLGELLSIHTRPIPGLGELLSRLAAHHTGDISLLPLDYFWRPAGQSDGDMGAIISKSGRWLNAVYGSPDEVLAYLKIRRREPRNFSVRLASKEDLDSCVDLKPSFVNVCCVKGAPSDVGTTLNALGCAVTRWHFPDLRDEDVDWASSILSPFSKIIRPADQYNGPVFSKVDLVLPRDGLTDKGARQLLRKVPYIRMLFHEPNSAHLTSACGDIQPGSQRTEMSFTNIYQWI